MEPLTAATLAAVLPHEQKQMLGERIYRFVMWVYPGLASKITGMLLEIDNLGLLYLLGQDKSLRAKVEEAVVCLRSTNRAAGRSSTTRVMAAWMFRE